jgi:hypothetical protein
VTNQSEWLRSDEQTNALDYLEKAHFFISRLANDEWAWKWVAIALHGALYGFAISALKQGNLDNVLKKPIAKLKKGQKPELISLPEAMKRCQDPSVIGGVRALQLSPDQKRSVKILNEDLRNVFQHFVPGGRSTGMSGAPAVASDCLDMILHLALNTHGAIHLSEEQKHSIRFLASDSKRILGPGQAGG